MNTTTSKKMVNRPWLTPEFTQIAAYEVVVTCTATMLDGRERTVTERFAGNGTGIVQVVEKLQAKRSKWFPFAGCEVTVDFGKGASRYVLEDAWGVFSLVK